MTSSTDGQQVEQKLTKKDGFLFIGIGVSVVLLGIFVTNHSSFSDFPVMSFIPSFKITR